MKIDLYKGDCLDVMDRLIEQGVKVDAITCDPPYGTTSCKWDSVIPFEPMWDRLKQLRREDGSAIVLFGSEPFSSTLRMSNINEFKYDWIWDKVRPSGFQNAKFIPMKRHEIITVFSKGKVNWNPQMELRDKPVKGKIYSKTETAPFPNIDGKVRTYTHKNPQTILVFNKGSDGKYVHPTQKPVALLEYLVLTYTNEGDTVLDFTMGSGTTGIACVNTGRNFIGIENDEKYFNIATDRISKAKGELK